jgi:Icc-related predicted phosphoesterase
MRLHILSDLHLGVGRLDPPQVESDLVVLAGDIARPGEAVAWARRFDRPVLFVPGNHEFYGSSVEEAIAELRELCAGTNVTLLERDEVVVDGVRFLGTTLWTDFRLHGDGAVRQEAMQLAQTLIRDFSRIRRAPGSAELFAPANSVALFEAQSTWLLQRLAVKHDGPTVVITHHPPSARSIHPRFASSPLNPAFASATEHMLDRRCACLWIHGHMHDSFDRIENGVRVICNPRGYAKEGLAENQWFDPALTVDLDPLAPGASSVLAVGARAEEPGREYPQVDREGRTPGSGRGDKR